MLLSKISISAWGHPDVLCLISLFKDNKKKMETPTIKKSEVWNDISIQLSHKGVTKKTSMCEKKWNNLKIRYVFEYKN